MSPAFKKITIVLVILTLAYAGYYFFIQQDTTAPGLGGDMSLESFAKVQKYIERREVLDRVKLDTALFNDPLFRSLVSFSEEEVTQPIGRINPFDEVDAAGTRE
jgi:hypothetical protein